MQSFFSGTDLSTLRSEGKDTNHFVSLIVNNAGVYCAAITRKMNVSIKGNEIVNYQSFNGIDKTEENFKEETYTYIEYFPLTVTREIVAEPKSELELRLEELKKSQNSYINKGQSSGNPFDRYKAAVTPKKAVQLELPFSKEDKEVSSTKYPLAQEPSDAVELYSDDTIKTTFKQLVTFNLFSPLNRSLDLDVWMKNLPVAYEKLFKDQLDFNYCAETFVEMMALNLPLELSISADETDVSVGIWAQQMIDEFSKYPSNDYVTSFINILERWLV